MLLKWKVCIIKKLLWQGQVKSRRTFETSKWLQQWHWRMRMTMHQPVQRNGLPKKTRKIHNLLQTVRVRHFDTRRSLATFPINRLPRRIGLPGLKMSAGIVRELNFQLRWTDMAFRRLLLADNLCFYTSRVSVPSLFSCSIPQSRFPAIYNHHVFP